MPDQPKVAIIGMGPIDPQTEIASWRRTLENVTAERNDALAKLAEVTRERDELKVAREDQLRVILVSNQHYREAVDSAGIWPTNDRPGIMGVVEELKRTRSTVEALTREVENVRHCGNEVTRKLIAERDDLSQQLTAQCAATKEAEAERDEAQHYGPLLLSKVGDIPDDHPAWEKFEKVTMVIVETLESERDSLKAENARLSANAARYEFIRSERLREMLAIFPTCDTSDVGLDYAIDSASQHNSPSA